MENARHDLSTIKASSNDQFEINKQLMVVREHESRLASVEAKIRNNSVNSLHHQLKAERDVLRREQLDQLKTAKVSISNKKIFSKVSQF